MIRSLAALLMSAAVAAGCIQLPTEKQEVVDLRPQLSFSMADSASDPSLYRVFVDELDMGSVGNYLSGKGALKVLPGTHVVRVEMTGKPVLQERHYLGDGATKTILVPR